MKECKLCSSFKEEHNFYNDKSKKTGLSTYCKTCSIFKRATTYQMYKPQNKEYQKEYHFKNKEKAKERHREYLYGLSKVEHQNMKETQLFSCLICKEKEDELKRGLFVDHCHATGKVRGLLCQSCNTLLGMAKDDIKILQDAIQYLIKTKEQNG